MSILNLNIFKMINDEHHFESVSNENLFAEINRNIYHSILHIVDMENNILLSADFC